MRISYQGTTRRQGLCAIALAVATLAGANMALAAPDSWPNRPIKMLIGFSAGGAVDNVGRQLAQGLGARLGQSVVVENKPGATGTLAGDAAAKSLPDGYTVLLGTQSTMLVAPAVYPKMPFRPMEDLAPISLVASVPLVLVVHPSVPVQNVKELIALARAQKGELAYASSGQGGPQHVASELLNQMAGVKMVHIPYKGESNALADVLGAQVTVMFGNLPTLLPSIRSGKLRAIAVSSLQRSDVAPDIPTVAESGLPGFEALTWFGLFAPVATPKPVIERLHREIVTSLADKEFQSKLRGQGLTLVGNDPAQFRSYMQTETVKWAKLVESAKIKPD
ncbi:tripartite tricarboxylate transporter substrate binding protein [Acidovorax sp. CCYZU-2555]|uniref:Bug family tripartite tricarboxylate transporter substrate binding protein n=1 Tax=Acidovorax sp. CCYZU-2555 TaxID=2835042 RepID=UPI0020BEBB9D|nr:tripartite tricarboxylate transporter substrate binding protein [Acidovorax sp. CCYZU-2555]